jgi:hypothetical protein
MWDVGHLDVTWTRSESDLQFKRGPNPSLVLKREVTSGAIRGVTGEMSSHGDWDCD